MKATIDLSTLMPIETTGIGDLEQSNSYSYNYSKSYSKSSALAAEQREIEHRIVWLQHYLGVNNATRSELSSDQISSYRKELRELIRFNRSIIKQTIEFDQTYTNTSAKCKGWEAAGHNARLQPLSVTVEVVKDWEFSAVIPWVGADYQATNTPTPTPAPRVCAQCGVTIRVGELDCHTANVSNSNASGNRLSTPTNIVTYSVKAITPDWPTASIGDGYTINVDNAKVVGERYHYVDFVSVGSATEWASKYLVGFDWWINKQSY